MCASSTQTSTLAQIRRPTTTTHPKAGDAYILPGINLQAHSHNGRPIRPVIANAPIGVLNPLAMTLSTHLGALPKQPSFHAAPPPLCVHVKTVVSRMTGSTP